MSHVRVLYGRCRTDRDVMLTTTGIAFWLSFGLALFAWHWLVGFPSR